jgi:hyperosmotically inducible protein
MKNSFAIGCLVVGSLLAPSVVLAADSNASGSHPEAYVKDSVITTKIKAKLAEDKMSSLFHISVDTDKNGAVYLSGTARSGEAITKAVAIAHQTEGVTSVKSSIVVKKDE